MGKDHNPKEQRELDKLFKAYEQCQQEQIPVRVATCKGVFNFSPVANDDQGIFVKLDR